MMGKVAILKLEGDLKQQGFNVTVTIAPEGDPTSLEISGVLPPNPQLAAQIEHHWQEKYRSLGIESRPIRPHKITHIGSIQRQIAECRTSGQQIHHAFQKWLQAESFLPLDQRLREELNRDETIRLLIRTQDSCVQKLPWHLWDFIERYPQAEVALSSLEYRRTPMKATNSPHSSIRILGIFGDSTGLDLSQDRRILENLPHAETVILVEPQLKDINDQLWQQHWDIIFFAGHGETLDGEGRIQINATESLTLNQVWYGLRQAVAQGLQLAIFNSCDGLGLLARHLDDVQIPQMLIMRELVPDEVAQRFLKDFLTAFAGGKSLYLAAREARERLQGLENQYPCASWLPVIWQNPAVMPMQWVKKGSILLSLKTQWQRSLGMVGAFLLLVGGLYAGGRSPGAVRLNNVGMKAHRDGQLSQAQQYYHFAAWLNPNYAQPDYNLGWLCDESLADMDCAIASYQKAAMKGLPEASAEVARLYLLQGKETAALKATWHCLEHTEYDAVKAACLKNRGWIRLQQQRWVEAQQDLQAALDLAFDSPHTHCLLAQVLEAQNQKLLARQSWQEVLNFSEYNVPEQDECIAIAQQRLAGEQP